MAGRHAAQRRSDRGTLDDAPPVLPDVPHTVGDDEPTGRRGRRLLRELLWSGGAVVAVVAVVGLLYLASDRGGGDSPAVHRPAAVDTIGDSPSPHAASAPAAAPAAGGAPAAPGATPPPAARPPLSVLNNSRVTGLAADAAARFRAAGWPVALVGNVHGRYATTTVYYAPGQLAAARALAAAFGGLRVHPRFSGLPGEGLTVVVTRDFRG